MLSAHLLKKRQLIVFSSGILPERSGYEYMPEHVLCHIFKGEIKTIESAKEMLFRSGETLLFKKNHLIKCEKRPGNDGHYSVVFIVFTKSVLNEFRLEQQIAIADPPPDTSPVINLSIKPAISGLIASLKEYLQSDYQPGEKISEHKAKEALFALLEADGNLAHWLFHSSKPEKTNLYDFMEAYYKFNVPLSKFAELTGRSLSTFQRDFFSVFKSSPSKWLLNRRLEEARKLLINSGIKSSDIYLDLGFEDLSHFSRAFRKMYGIPPSKAEASAYNTTP